MVNTWKVKLGLDHPNAVTAMIPMNNLALTNLKQEQQDEVQKLVMEMMEKEKPASSHPDTLTNISESSTEVACRNEGILNEAEKLKLDVVNSKKVKPGSGHLDATLTAMTNQPVDQLEIKQAEEQEPIVGDMHI